MQEIKNIVMGVLFLGTMLLGTFVAAPWGFNAMIASNRAAEAFFHTPPRPFWLGEKP